MEQGVAGAAEGQAILRETIALIEVRLGQELKDITVDRAAVGLFFTGVKLTCGTAGACATPFRALLGEAPRRAREATWRGHLRGAPASELAGLALSEHPLDRALGIAVVNALADLCWRRAPHPDLDLREDADAFDVTPIAAGDRVVMVGAFRSALPGIKARAGRLLVLEKDPTMLRGDDAALFRPAEAAPASLGEADVVLITGSALVYHSLEALLVLVRPGARVTIVGPTVGLLADAFLRRGATILGGMQVTDPDEFLALIAEAGAGRQFFGRAARKIALVKRVLSPV